MLKKVEKKPKINPKEVLKERRSYCDEVHENLEKKGVDFFTPGNQGGSLNIDKDYLILPPSITNIPSRDLGEYLNAFTQQKAYLRTLLGYAEMYAEEARLAYMSASETRYRELLNSKLSETAKEREVNTDSKVRPSYEEWCNYKNQIKLLSYNIQSIEEIIFMISREVSRRTGDFSEENRNYNVNNRR
jgi:hypothetical protein